MATSNRTFGQRRRRFGRVRGRSTIVTAAMLATMLGALVLLALPKTDLTQLFALPVAPAVATTPAQITARFVLCSANRDTCVVDGDTFWLGGIKYRIADINTPETAQPQCPAEAALGRRASQRLTELLSAGPFTLAAADRDEDRYGRKLRIVERNGRSLGRVLVDEGLAEDWQGVRRGWC